MSFTYEYDEANQLVRENLYYGSGNANNATYTYEYDDWGNILNKKKYAYTTDTLGTVVETISYGYNDSQWGDLPRRSKSDLFTKRSNAYGCCISHL